MYNRSLVPIPGSKYVTKVKFYAPRVSPDKFIHERNQHKEPICFPVLSGNLAAIVKETRHNRVLFGILVLLGRKPQSSNNYSIKASSICISIGWGDVWSGGSWWRLQPIALCLYRNIHTTLDYSFKRD